MGEDTDSTPALNHHGFLPDHNYVTEGKKMTQEAVCVCSLYWSISFRQVCIYVLNFWSVSKTECVTKLAQGSFLSFYKLCVNYCSDRRCPSHQNILCRKIISSKATFPLLSHYFLFPTQHFSFIILFMLLCVTQLFCHTAGRNWSGPCQSVFTFVSSCVCVSENFPEKRGIKIPPHCFCTCIACRLLYDNSVTRVFSLFAPPLIYIIGSGVRLNTWSKAGGILTNPAAYKTVQTTEFLWFLYKA